MMPYEVVFVLCLLTPVVVHSLPRDCDDIHYLNNSAPSGVYNIYPVDFDTAVEVYCDMDTDGGKWTVFQRRMDGTVLFYRPWDHYKRGFGNADGEYWLGLENIYYLTTRRRCELRVDMEDFSGSSAFAHYTSFYIHSEDYGYMLHIDLFKDGEAGDSLSSHSGQKFSTLDRDQDASDGSHCAKEYMGGHWYSNCYSSNPNGVYVWAGDTRTIGITWWAWSPGYLKSIAMKIRPLTPRKEQNEDTDG